MTCIIRVQGVTTRYETTPVLKDICFEIEKGDFVGIVGPNGSGKTTLLNNLGRLVPFQSGRILLDERDLSGYRHKDAARKISAVPQHHPRDIEFSVYDVVMMGRTPHWHFFQRESDQDRKIVDQALKLAGIHELSQRPVSDLSGGERQRVFIAQAIAQEPVVMLLDEPTSHLDISFQISIMDALQRLNQTRSVTIMAVLHDLNLAAQYCNKMIMLKDGMIAGAGSPAEVLTAERIEDVYGCRVAVTEHPVVGSPYVVLYSQPKAERISSGGGYRLHIVSGGGTGAGIMDMLQAKGFSLTAGVLNIGDSDWQKAQELKIPVVEEMPFSAISESKKEENLDAARKSDVVIVTATPFGSGNLPNAEILLQLAREAKPIILMDYEQISSRDYTGQKAAKIFSQIHPFEHVHTTSHSHITALVESLTESR